MMFDTALSAMKHQNNLDWNNTSNQG
jgi:hypothetical protein